MVDCAPLDLGYLPVPSQRQTHGPLHRLSEKSMVWRLDVTMSGPTAHDPWWMGAGAGQRNLLQLCPMGQVVWNVLQESLNEWRATRCRDRETAIASWTIFKSMHCDNKFWDRSSSSVTINLQLSWICFIDLVVIFWLNSIYLIKGGSGPQARVPRRGRIAGDLLSLRSWAFPMRGAIQGTTYTRYRMPITLIISRKARFLVLGGP